MSSTAYNKRKAIPAHSNYALLRENEHSYVSLSLGKRVNCLKHVNLYNLTLSARQTKTDTVQTV